MSELSRRGLLGGLAAGAAAFLPTRSAQAKDACPTPKTYPNSHFYTPDGTLDVAKAKAAYYELMEFHNFPVMPVLKTDQFWVLEFGLGKFTEVGMGGIFYINNERDDYLLHDIWLFPGQMIAEHYHVKTEKVAAKMEAWLVRHGSAWFGSEGEPSENANEIIPPTHRECARARHVEFKTLGEVVKLETAEARHWVKAGPQGAIITEVATYHSMDALRFTHPDISLG